MFYKISTIQRHEFFVVPLNVALKYGQKFEKEIDELDNFPALVWDHNTYVLHALWTSSSRFRLLVRVQNWLTQKLLIQIPWSLFLVWIFQQLWKQYNVEVLAAIEIET